MSNPSAPSTQMFSVNIDGETVAETWNQAVPMPAHLAQRVDQLEKQHHSTSPTDMENKCKQATQNHKENLENISTKAHMATVKGEHAKARRAEFGENMTLMGNTMGNTEQSIKLPKALATRVESLTKQTKTSDTIMTKQEKAAANRQALNEAKQMKASVSSTKIAAAKTRKEVQVRESMAASGFFQVDASQESSASSGGWNQTIPLPKHLAERVKTVSKQFDYDVMQREARTASNHQNKLDGIAAKAKVASERVEQAKQRRLLAKGDANHFTVTAEKDADEVQGANGWASKPTLPAHLQERLDTLSKKQQQVENHFTKQEAAAVKRAAFHAEIVKKGRAETEKLEASANRRAIASGDATHFTVSEAKFAATEGEGELENNNGWGRQQTVKLPEHLQERLASMDFSAKDDMTTRQSRAATNRSEFQRSIAMKASAESDRVAQVQVQQKLMKGDANTFTVTFDAAEDSENEKKQGWVMKPPLPIALKERLHTLNQQHSSKMDQPTKQAKAAANRLQFQQSIAAKAAYENEKSMNATSRRLVAKGDANTLFSVSAVEDEENQASVAGWGAQNTRIPPHLQDRLTEMTAKHATQPHAVRQQAADHRRTLQLRSVANKAALETDKISNALSRKKLETGDANTFTVTLGQDGGDPNTQAQGWKQKKPRLPTRLANRLKSLGETFQMKPYTARVEKASAKRAAHLTALVSKASLENDKLAAAESRRQLASGDDSHFTVASTNDDDAVVQQQGWGYKPPMPDRLQKRLHTLNQQHNSKMDQPTKQAKAKANRLQFQHTIAAKAAYESEKGMNAKSKKAVIVGNATTVFTTQVTQGEGELSASNSDAGWGVQTALPVHLEQRYKALNAKFHGHTDPMTKQKAAAQKRAQFNNQKILKAHESVDRMLAAQSRKSLQEGNEACFRVEFTEATEDQGEHQQGWGNTSPKLPKHLVRRAAAMIKQSPTKNPFEAMNKANKATENRDEYLNALVAKAHQTSVKMEAARLRKLRNEMDAGIILINTANQRKLSPVKLPTRLAERVEALTLKFGYNGAEKEVQVQANRIRRLNEIRLKAAAGSKRAAAAKERRAQMAKQQLLERIQNPMESNGDAEEDEGCAKKTRKSCTVC